MRHPDEHTMRSAISLVQKKFKKTGLCSTCCIIVKDDEIISTAMTSVIEDNDPTCHAEINAIKKAAKKLGTRKLTGCYLYTTYEPCPMCASAAIWARMKGIVYGARMEDETVKCPQRVRVKCTTVVAKGNPKLLVYPDFYREECRKLLFS